MDVLKSLRYSLHLVGISERDGKMGAKMYTLLAIHCFVTMSTVLFILDKWDNIDDRVFALKALVFVCTFKSYMLLTIDSWNDYASMLDTFRRMSYPFPYEVSSRRKYLLGMMETRVSHFNRMWFRMMVVYAVSMAVVPLAVVMLKSLLLSEGFQNIIKENLSSAFPLYFPKYVKRFRKMEHKINMAIYVFGYLTHSLYAVYSCVSAHLANVSSLCAMANVEYELKLLRLSLSEMDDSIHQAVRSGDKYFESALRCFLRYFVRHHQDIYRRFNVISKGTRWITTCISAGASAYMCMSIYTIAQKDKVVLKLQEAVFFVVWAYAVYFLDVGGERIITEHDNLRNAVYGCSWVDKPRWFKASLAIAMTRSCKPIELRPFGLFSLSLNSYAMTMKAAYSYYNLLHNFKKD